MKKRKIRQLLCYLGILSLIFSGTGKLYAEDSPSLNAKVRQIAMAYGRTVILKEDGTVWMCGDTTYGLFYGTSTIPQQVTGIDHVKQIAAGDYHTVALKEDGTVYTWGWNNSGQLGTGSFLDDKAKTPQYVSGLDQIEEIIAGREYVIVMKEDGTIYAWGHNNYGQLGLGSNNTYMIFPTKMQSLSNMQQIAAGYEHAIALKKDGTVYVWGSNIYGQLSLDDNNSNKNVPYELTELKNVKQVAAGGNSTAVIKEDGTAWMFGHNGFGQLGNGEVQYSNNVPTQSVVYTTQIPLTADTSDNDVDHELEIIFPPNRTFEGNIQEIKANGETLTKNKDYEIGEGKIVLKPGGGHNQLIHPEDIMIEVSADYFPDTSVVQTINTGKAHHMTLEKDIKAPVANNEKFAVQPVLQLRDQYDNPCTNESSTQVTASKNDSGNWELKGTTTVTATGGKIEFTDLKAINDGRVEGAQLKFSADGLLDAFSSEVTLPAELPPNLPEIRSVEEGSQSVKLTWRAAEGADCYGVYVSTVPMSYTTSAAITIYTDYEVTGLKNGQTYYFVVTAINEGGESGYSNEVSAVPKTVPQPPENVYVVAGNRKVIVSFDEPTDNGGSPVIKYIVTSDPDNITAEGTKGPITVNGLKNGITYTFTVKAVNEVGESYESLPSNSVIPRASSGGGSSGNSQGSDSKGKTEDDKDLLIKKNKEEQKIDVVVEINGKTVTGIAEATLKSKNENNNESNSANNNENHIAELIINEEKLKELLKKETEQAVIRFVFDGLADGKKIDQIICNLSEEMIKYSGYIELIIPLSKDIDDEEVITGVRTQEDGSLSHIPTKIITKDGKKYARLKTRLGGRFTVIRSSKSFSDMKGHWAEAIVNELASRLILDTDRKENFIPSKKATRAEFAEIITKALGLMQKGAGKDLFSDVSKEDTYYDAVTIANEYGIISGYGDGSFRPDKEITREEAMAMMVRAMKVAGIEISLSQEEIDTLLSGYRDTSSISSWAREYIAICIKLGIVEGRPNQTIAPKDSISMAEMTIIIYRLLEEADFI